MTSVALQTEFDFTLPCGFVDDTGALHRSGVMRLATALDEVVPLQDARVHRNQAYVAIVLLSRVITRLGGFAPVPSAIIERLFAADFAYLQDLYVRVNQAAQPEPEVAETQCPDCGSRFAVEIPRASA